MNYYIGEKQITKDRADEIIAQNKKIMESNDISAWLNIQFVVAQEVL